MRTMTIATLAVLALSGSLLNANLVQPRPVDPQEAVAALSDRSYIGVYKSTEPARVQLSGIGTSCLGLYVFDSDGSCVSRDDIHAPKYCDELLSDWVADANGRYVVTVRNAGLETTRYNLAIR